MPLYLHLFQDPLMAGALLNCSSFAITIFVSLRIGRLVGLEAPDVYIFVFSVIFSYSFLQYHLFLWTEAAFTATITILFYCIITDKPVQYIIFCLIVAFLFRKAAGFTTIATVALYFNQRKIRHGLIISGAMGIAFIAWEAFTIYHTGSSLSRETWNYHVTLARIPYLDSLTSWILPRVLSATLRLLLLAAGIIAINMIRRRSCHSSYLKETKFQSVFIFWFVYMAGLFIFSGAEDFHDADRFLAVILPFFMLTLFSFLLHVFDSEADRRRIRALMIIWLVYPGSKTLYYLLCLFPNI